ncbi:MAG: tRNA (adenosine(37)-N6)-threonylcarbamoyltransferase complex dimerization subunit type 1 TsaB, partial [Alphaproteobacteria bacterium]|nr:tRNA (adenosine(37)-N6)-threonylcarbamoyltransferase complex dimerization subunit type 1 TsaB [Alphaproteobacteria bacterium]
RTAGMTASGSRPITLALDCAGSACSVVLAVGDTIICGERSERRYGQAEALMPMVEAVMSNAGFVPAELTLVATSVGPGSFTGIRVGLAAARGIALATGAQLVGVTSFEAVAGRLGWPVGAAPRFLLIALESRREDIYVQFFSHRGEPLGQPVAVMPGALREAVDRMIGAAPLAIAGDAAPRAVLALADRAGCSRLEGSAPDAPGVLRAGLRHWRSERFVEARPLYLRPPDVTVADRKVRSN